MHPHRVPPGAATDDVAGMILCHDVEAGGTRLPKGHAIRPADLPTLRAAAGELHLLALDPGDVHEDDAGPRLAGAAAGDGVAVGAPAAGQWPLVATRRGLLHVAVDALHRANAIDGVLVYTAPDGRVVDAGEELARARIAPLALDARRVDAAVAAARAAGGLLHVRPFAPRRVGAVVQERMGEAGAARFRAALGEKLAWLGSTLLPPALAADSGDGAAIAAAIARLAAAGAELVVVAGTRAMDPLDPAWNALGRLGAATERVGVAVHPGSMLWLARHEALPIVGMPSCGAFAGATALDLVLPRLLAGERVDRAMLAALGHGGLLDGGADGRLPPYRGAGAARGSVADGGRG